jgi:hypothetical protein
VTKKVVRGCLCAFSCAPLQNKAAGVRSAKSSTGVKETAQIMRNEVSAKNNAYMILEILNKILTLSFFS